jgi:hypothetical protein
LSFFYGALAIDATNTASGMRIDICHVFAAADRLCRWFMFPAQSRALSFSKLWKAGAASLKTLVIIASLKFAQAQTELGQSKENN